VNLALWASGAPGAVASILEAIDRTDPYGAAAIRADLAAGGRLRVVLEAGDSVRSVRLRVRLLSKLGRNRWVFGVLVEVAPPRPRVVGG